VGTNIVKIKIIPLVLIIYAGTFYVASVEVTKAIDVRASLHILYVRV
jgi:hypothetical protein